MTANTKTLKTTIQWIGLIAGPLLAILLYSLLPHAYPNSAGETVEFSNAGRATTALAVWMAVWWMTEAVELYATALLPLVALPMTGAAPVRAAAAPYAHELIFLFMGGFLIALAMQRWGLHRRMALRALRAAGDHPAGIVACFMGVTAFFSMWVSNTATAVMMLPIALSIISLVEQVEPGTKTRPHFALCLLLGIAYAASIGGIGTIIGTPPNVFLASFIQSNLGQEISFVRWMGVGLPLVAVFLPLAWLMLTRVLYPLRGERIEGSRAVTERAYQELGAMSRGERIVLAVFLLAALSWITRPLLVNVRIGDMHPMAGLSDPVIAMVAALILFVVPVDVKRRVFVMNWETALKLPWGILLLFGGGLSLAAAIRVNGVGEYIGHQLGILSGIPVLLLVMAVIALVIFLTELTSNTATTATFIPILAALAPVFDLHPFMLIVPAAIAASCAFMLPVATPPNAIVFGSGHVTIQQMIRAGFWLNLAGVVLITLLVYTVMIRMLGV
ncbi:MAG: SLC13 family permease [Gemmatimonadetes bacterium]|nr:SLC13 family permease [Gemmatimonadota bacterium]MYG85806.1 SLC13 family permease [Gemmatimonadota bacterium]MYJ89778.1 SLC13 family permease [Gemmatimonadota bacterium]